MRSRPVVGCCSPLQIRIRVDLPAPFSPSRAVTRPDGNSTDTSFSARTAPKVLLTSSTASIAIEDSGPTGPGMGTFESLRQSFGTAPSGCFAGSSLSTLSFVMKGLIAGCSTFSGFWCATMSLNSSIATL